VVGDAASSSSQRRRPSPPSLSSRRPIAARPLGALTVEPVLPERLCPPTTSATRRLPTPEETGPSAGTSLRFREPITTSQAPAASPAIPFPARPGTSGQASVLVRCCSARHRVGRRPTSAAHGESVDPQVMVRRRRRDGVALVQRPELLLAQPHRAGTSPAQRFRPRSREVHDAACGQQVQVDRRGRRSQHIGDHDLNATLEDVAGQPARVDRPEVLLYQALLAVPRCRTTSDDQLSHVVGVDERATAPLPGKGATGRALAHRGRTSQDERNSNSHRTNLSTLEPGRHPDLTGSASCAPARSYASSTPWTGPGRRSVLARGRLGSRLRGRSVGSQKSCPRLINLSTLDDRDRWACRLRSGTCPWVVAKSSSTFAASRHSLD